MKMIYKLNTLALLVFVGHSSNYAQYKTKFDYYIDSILGVRDELYVQDIAQYSKQEEQERIIFYTLEAIFAKHGIYKILNANDSLLIKHRKGNKAMYYKLGIQMNDCTILNLVVESKNVYTKYLEALKKEMIGIDITQYLTDYRFNNRLVGRLDRDFLCQAGYVTLETKE